MPDTYQNNLIYDIDATTLAAAASSFSHTSITMKTLPLHRRHTPPPPPAASVSVFPSNCSCFLVTLILLSDFLTVSAAGRPSSSSSSPNSSDLSALLAIKASFVDPHGWLSSWIAKKHGDADAAVYSYCSGSWVGVSCDSRGNVVALHLPNKGLEGSLSADIGQLSSLRRLSLHHNTISGSIPTSISSLHNLRALYLFQNLFTGTIPSSFSPDLKVLDLSRNRLSGAIPVELASNSPFLHRLDLSFNNLSSSIPPSLASLSRLDTLILSDNQLVGQIPPQLSQLSSLQTLDLSHNRLSGFFPTASSSVEAEFFSSLVSLNLSRNELTGSLPARIGHMVSLRVLRLSENHFYGTIPADLVNITGLTSLDVSQNNFSGEFPSSLVDLANLTSLNCSYNDLTGEVPAKLASYFDASAFAGNLRLCGFPSASPCAASVSASSSKHVPSGTSPDAEAADAHPPKKTSILSVIVVVVGVLTILLLVACLFAAIILCCFRKLQARKAREGAEEKAASQTWSGGSSTDQKKEYFRGAAGSDFGGKLVHFEGSLGFSADDLLCATAEVLGKSTVGTVYKAALEDDNLVAVKRLRDGIVKSQKDFEAEVKLIGAIRHPNLLPLRAYYWGPKDEKLLIFDFMPRGSLASLIHARRPDRKSSTPLTWPTRMKIVVGAARGLAHLHHHEKTIHGNLSSSNILVDRDLNPKLSDFCLSRLMTQAANATVISAAAGASRYMAPELTKLRKPTPKSDVYSLGIVMLELLTGKAPGTDLNSNSESAEGSEGAMDLVEWVAYMVKQQWSNEVFDVEIMSSENEEELMKTLHVAMACVKLLPMERPDVSVVVAQLELMMPELRLKQ